MDANNCLSFRAADTSSSSHCKHTCAKKIYSKIIYKSSYYLNCIPLKKTNNINDRRKYRIFQFSATYTDYNWSVVLSSISAHCTRAILRILATLSALNSSGIS